MTTSAKGTIVESSKLLRYTNPRVTTVYLDYIASQEANEITEDLASDLMQA